MTPSAVQLALVALLGAVLALDQGASPRFLLSQPLVSGALCGALLGRFEPGVVAGGVLQMIFMAMLPVGGARLPEAWLGSLAVCIAAPGDLGMGRAAWLDDARLAAPAVVGVLTAYAGGRLWHLQRRLQGRLAADLPARVEAGDLRGIDRLHEAGLFLHAGRGAATAVLVALLAAPAARLLAGLGVAAPAGRLALALAAVALLRRSGGRKRLWPLLAGGAAGLLLAVPW